jgi:type VI secretion system protein ImpA
MPLQTSELLQPIEVSNPGGADIRYEPVFDQIKRARIEEADLPAGDWSRERKTADYALVVRLGTEVLKKKSKDLQVGAWLTEALLKREAFGGLRTGLELLGALQVEFWEYLYPEIEDGDLEFRAAPLEWVAQYLEASVRMVPITPNGKTIFDYRESRALGYEQDADSYEKREAREAAIAAGKLSAEAFDEAFDAVPKSWYKQLIADIDGAIAATDALDMVGQEKFGDLAPRYAPLRNAIVDVRQIAGQLLAKKLETDPDPVEAEAVVAEGALEAGAVEASVGAAGTVSAPVSAALRTRADAEARVAAAARFLRAENPTDPAPYLLLRGFRWGELRVQGTNIEPKLLAAPPTELRAKLRGMLLDGQWAQLLEAAEEVMATPFGRGWLDLQRYVLSACSNLGSEYDHVGSAIRGALQALVHDLPQLPSLVLMDDTPTANVETQGWLREVLTMADSPPSGSALAGAPPDGRGTGGRGAYDRAMERVRAGEPDKAIEMLIRQAAQERSARDRFLRRAEAVSIMVESGREAVAMPILEQLVQEIDKHTLEEWEAGDIVAQPLALLHRCLRRVQGDSSTTENLYLRICRLDPLQAIQIAGQPTQ